jgi:4-hydroxybenzoyl-CoA reductase subunit beta
MMRLPSFRYFAARSVAEAVRIRDGEGPQAAFVAGGTDLYPNMKRRHQTPKVLVGLRRVRALRGVRRAPDGGLRVGPMSTLSALERHRAIRRERPALWSAIHSISTPILRNMGTIGGNVLLDTRCNYVDQTYEWRRAIRFCMKCEGDTCWVAPGSERCLAVQSSDTVPILCALEAQVRFASPRGEREIPIEELFRNDGIRYVAKEPDELLTDILLPPVDGVRAHYGKLRRRGAFDFPVLGVGIALASEGGIVRNARIFLGAVASAPVRVRVAEIFLEGKPLTDATIVAASDSAYDVAKPLDNTDFEYAWRKKMVRVYMRRGLEALRGAETPRTG